MTSCRSLREPLRGWRSSCSSSIVSAHFFFFLSFLPCLSIEIEDQISSIESAKLNAAVAYALNTLFFVHLRLRGEAAEKHQVKDELERVKRYMKKIQAVAAKAEARQTAAAEEAGEGQGTAAAAAAAAAGASQGGTKRRSASSSSSTAAGSSRRGGSKKRKQKRSKRSKRG